MNNIMIGTEHTIIIPGKDFNLNGILHIPQQAKGLVLFAHGSGSGRLSSRNQFVARIMQEAQLATLLFDLLTSAEEAIDNKTLALRFDIELLASRLLLATHWILQQPLTHKLSLGYFGASTGAAAAIIAAANQPAHIKAFVSRGGRPDLAGQALASIQVPTLLIVGGDDTTVIDLNQKAMAQLKKAYHQLEIIPHATHLFEEPGALEKVALLAKQWFLKYLTFEESNDGNS